MGRLALLLVVSLPLGIRVTLNDPAATMLGRKWALFFFFFHGETIVRLWWPSLKTFLAKSKASWSEHRSPSPERQVSLGSFTTARRWKRSGGCRWVLLPCRIAAFMSQKRPFSKHLPTGASRRPRGSFDANLNADLLPSQEWKQTLSLAAGIHIQMEIG